ncbi:MAG: adenylate/guanylate cyclase domain-containing protein [Burkholderiales bacterium]
MVKCPGCGEENPPRFRLCGYCGTALASQSQAHEIRKTVTLIFCDLKGSTALGERLDAEAMHEVKEQYFEAMVTQIHRHGGKVEKYIGDAIMAVFGLPRAHEDDALRAVRAAAEMQTALVEVNQVLTRRYGVTLCNRTGVNTGEVVANIDPGANQKLATGDAVNVAARLEQAAPDNGVYIGEMTYRLVRDAVRVERVEALELKGKTERVAAYRLVSVQGIDGNLRRQDTPIVGRDEELAALARAFREVRDGRAARLVTVFGDAGAGKSRLVFEAVARTAGQTQVVRGRCLPYGDGITFWPLVTMLRDAAEIRADDAPELAYSKVLGLVGERDVADRLAAATGLSVATFPLLELQWAARKFLEILSAEGPVLALIDDIHWAEPAFLDLLEHVIDASTGAPLLLLATSRHDLLEEHPQWGKRPSSSRIVLQPLSDAASTQVIVNLIGSADLPQGVIDRVVQAAEGNPLFVEQMLSMLIEGGALCQHDGRWTLRDPNTEITVPPTIHALLEARLDTLAHREREAVEPASVIGLEFAQPAVEALSRDPGRATVAAHLEALSGKRFIHRSAALPEELIYRFHHHLIREIVYNGLLKRARATLHTDFVRWADEVNAERGRALEFQEVLGYHLEQAHRYLAELGPLDEVGLAIGADASRRLGEAGGRAFARADMHAAVNLFRRAMMLVPPLDPQRLALLSDLAEGLMELGDFAAAREITDEAEAAATQVGDARLLHAARLRRMFLRLFGGEPGDWGSQALQVSADAVAALEPLGAHNELATAWRLTSFVHGVAGRYAESGRATLPYMDHARKAGNGRLLARAALGLANGILPGDTPVAVGIVQCEGLMADVSGNRQIQGVIMCIVAQLRAMNGEFQVARSLYRQGRAMLHDLGRDLTAAQSSVDVARVELLAGDLATAETELRADCDFLVKSGETYVLSTVSAVRARVLREQGRDDDAWAASKLAEGAAIEDDVDAQVQWRSARAPILARRGELAEAEQLAREAVQFASGAEVPLLLAEAHADLAEVLALAGRRDEAVAEYECAAALWARKGDVVSEARARASAARTGAGPSTKDLPLGPRQ